MIAAFGASLIVATYISAALRFTGTYRSVSVSGVSPLFTWLGIAGNACWVTYGVTTYPLFLVSGSVWVLVFLYIWWRVQGRRIWVRANLLVPVALSVGAAVTVAVGPDSAAWVAGGIITASAVPQAWRIWATRDLHGVAPFAWAWSAFSVTAWLVYALLESLTPVVIVNAVFLAVQVALLAGAVRAWRSPKSRVLVAL